MTAAQTQDKPRLGVLIANWNGELFLERCIGSVLAAGRQLGEPLEILVTDDASVDRSRQILSEQYPQVRVLAWDENVGFGEAVNRGMAAIGAERVFLLNNDLVLKTDFFERLTASWVEALSDEARELFAIGAQTLDWDTHAPNHAGQHAVWREGMIVQEHFQAESLALTGFFQAGACLIDRAKFLELGGFAAIFRPGYWEDYDLAYQASRRGWGCYYEPRAQAYHCGKGSMRRALGVFGVSLMLRRNHLLFVWANLTSPRLVREHCFGLWRLAWKDKAPTGEAGWGRAFFEALRRLPTILRLRRARRATAKVADAKILSNSTH